MLDRILEYRETQQFRKERQRKQNIRYLTIFFVVLLVLLLGSYVVDVVKPDETISTRPASTKMNQKEKQEIQEFAYVITKPLDALTSEDLKLVDTKAKDPCYEKNVELPREQMIEAIMVCKSVK